MYYHEFNVILRFSYIYLSSGCADIYFNSGPILNDGQWHFIVIIYDGAGTLFLYVDHALVQAATSFTAFCGIASTPVNYQTSGDNNYLNCGSYIGYLQNIVFYDYALSPTGN